MHLKREPTKAETPNPMVVREDFDRREDREGWGGVGGLLDAKSIDGWSPASNTHLTHASSAIWRLPDLAATPQLARARFVTLYYTIQYYTCSVTACTHVSHAVHSQFEVPYANRSAGFITASHQHARTVARQSSAPARQTRWRPVIGGVG
jgi:hypothetical protein